jgi:hypothetical protein
MGELVVLLVFDMYQEFFPFEVGFSVRVVAIYKEHTFTAIFLIDVWKTRPCSFELISRIY